MRKTRKTFHHSAEIFFLICIVIGFAYVLYSCLRCTHSSRCLHTSCEEGFVADVSDVGDNASIEREKDKELLPFDQCYVINLAETQEGIDRWKKIKNHDVLKKFATRFQGVYGKEYDYQPLIKHNIIADTWDYGAWLNRPSKIVKITPGEIGCILSHYNLWKKIVEDGIPVTMILEDDALRLPKNFIDRVKTEMEYLPQDWDIFLLGFWLHTGDKGQEINEHIFTVRNFALLHCYLITLEGAKKLLSLGPIDKPLDTWLSSVSHEVHIYRHNILINSRSKTPASKLIRQKNVNPDRGQIVHTNNWRFN